MAKKNNNQTPTTVIDENNRVKITDAITKGVKYVMTTDSVDKYDGSRVPVGHTFKGGVTITIGVVAMVTGENNQQVVADGDNGRPIRFIGWVSPGEYPKFISLKGIRQLAKSANVDGPVREGDAYTWTPPRDITVASTPYSVEENSKFVTKGEYSAEQAVTV